MFLISLANQEDPDLCMSYHGYKLHYGDVIMGAIASQITSLTIVYSTVYSDADQRKHQSSASLAFVVGNSPGTGEFPAQMASNVENVSICFHGHHTFSAEDMYLTKHRKNDTHTTTKGPLKFKCFLWSKLRFANLLMILSPSLSRSRGDE